MDACHSSQFLPEKSTRACAPVLDCLPVKTLIPSLMRTMGSCDVKIRTGLIGKTPRTVRFG